MQFLTDFADQAVILPVGLIMLLFLWQAGWRRGARAWASAFGLMLASMAGLKLLLASCGGGLTSPSGHTAAAALVWGGGAALLLRASRWQMAAAAGLAALFVGATRLALHVHSPLDVLVGGLVGIGCALLLHRLAGPMPAAVRPQRLLPGLVLAMLLLHGAHFHIEAAIRALALGWLRPGAC